MVDDNAPSADAIAEYLKAPDMETEVVYGGEACVARAKMDPPIDLIVLDMSMPGMNGVQVMEEFLKWNPPPPFKIITATAFADWQSAFGDGVLSGTTWGNEDAQSQVNPFSKILIAELDKSSGFEAMLSQIKATITKLKK